MANSGKIFFIFYTPLCKMYVPDMYFGQKYHEDIMVFLSFKLIESRTPSLSTLLKKTCYIMLWDCLDLVKG